MKDASRKRRNEKRAPREIQTRIERRRPDPGSIHTTHSGNGDTKTREEAPGAEMKTQGRRCVLTTRERENGQTGKHTRTHTERETGERERDEAKRNETASAPTNATQN
ncbi:hypothetical protein AB1N83_006843 [Pleurotus pulmonarius]